MRRFRFSLDSLVRLRSGELDRTQGLLAEARRGLGTAEADARTAWSLAGADGERFSLRLARGLEGAAVTLGSAAVEAQWARTREREASVLAARGQWEARRAEVVEARRSLKIVQRLRERALERHQRSEARREQRALDDATACLRARLGGGA